MKQIMTITMGTKIWAEEQITTTLGTKIGQQNKSRLYGNKILFENEIMTTKEGNNI
jgi:hypothetical protein